MKRAHIITLLKTSDKVISHLGSNPNYPLMPAKSKVQKAPKPTVLRDFFESLDDKTNGPLLLTLNLEAELRTSKVRLDTELAEVSSQAKASEELYAQLQKHKLDEQQAQQAIKTADSQVCDLVKSTLAIPLLEPAFGPADRHLEHLRTRNLLPADVSKGLIERFIKGEQCVCGICPDARKRAELTKYLGITPTFDKDYRSHSVFLLSANSSSRFSKTAMDFSPLYGVRSHQ